MTSASILSLQDLAVGYNDFAPVLHSVSLTVEAGEVLAVVGANGAGKTTLFKTILGVLEPLSGSVAIDGRSPSTFRREKGIGYLPEVPAFPRHWTAGGVLDLATTASSRRDVTVDEACELGGVDFDLSLPVGHLSKGMARRLGNAVALISRPPLILLDEPEAGLDPGQRVGLRSRIRRMAETATVLVATHDLREAAEVSGRALVLQGGTGRVVVPAPGEERLDHERLEALFLTPTDTESTP